MMRSESPSKFFSYVFRPGLFKDFYTSKDYESISHMIRRLLKPHSKYGSNLKLFCSCLDNSVLINILIPFLKSGGKMKVVITDPQVSESIIEKMDTDDNCLINTDYIVSVWKKLAEKYSVDLYITQVPIFHNIICIDKNDMHPEFLEYCLFNSDTYNNTEDIRRLCRRRILSFHSVGVQSPTEWKRFYESPLLVKSRALNNTDLLSIQSIK